jgi:hypothetical protein
VGQKAAVEHLKWAALNVFCGILMVWNGPKADGFMATIQ